MLEDNGKGKSGENQRVNGRRAVSARELYDFLEVETRFNDWIQRMFEYGFEKDADYSEVLLKNEYNPSGGRPSIDYALTLDCAKEVAMIQRTSQGKIAREYFFGLVQSLLI